MEVCIVGAGAIGGYLGVKLHQAGQRVTVVARGAHLAAIRRNGLKLISSDYDDGIVADVPATDRIAAAGHPDVVMLAVKAHQVAPIAAQLRTLFRPSTIVVPLQNGIPWWYFQKHGGPFEGYRIRTVDPDGAIAANIEPERIIGAIAYPAAEIASPGVIRHIEGDRFPLGELDGSESQRVQQLSSVLVGAGFKSPILRDIRSELWLKLWGNLTFNPLSALTHSTLVDICEFPLTRDLARRMMIEAQAIAHKLGVSFRVSLDRRIAGAGRVGKHKTSMLQDVEAGRATEVDALVGAVLELGKLTETPTPSIETLYACMKLLARTMQQEQIFIKGHRLRHEAA